ncbi:MAG: hypothetical protein ACRYGC_06520 [Janthinobacterium lividum]
MKGWRHHGPTALAAAGAALLVLLPVLVRPGWPRNHEMLAFFTRMSAIAGQWRLGHLIPVWSTSEQWGYGSPAPALYHKAFLYTSSGFYLVSGDPKLSVCLALGGFMVVAFTGAAAAVRIALGRADTVGEWTAGTLLVSCNYATTDWLVRGAMAEFAALSVASWVFAWCIALIVRGRWTLWIGPAMAALALSHSVVGLFSLLPLGVALLVAGERWPGRVAGWAGPAAVTLLMFAAIAGPFVAPMAVLFAWCRPDVLLQPGYVPAQSHVAFGRLFWDTDWHWGERWQGFTVQLDLLPLLGLLALPVVRPRRDGVATFLVATAVLLLVLQTRQAVWLYDAVPGANYIQFSWRLLTFLSVAVAIGGGLFAARFGGLGVVVGVLLVASTLPNKPWWSGMAYDWYSPAEIAGAMGGDVLAAGEYLPRTTAPTMPAPAGEVVRPAFPPEGACAVTPAEGPQGEVVGTRFVVRCASAGEAVLPLFQVPGLSGGMTRRCDDPRARIELPQGESVLDVRFATWSSLLLASVRGEGSGFGAACR